MIYIFLNGLKYEDFFFERSAMLFADNIYIINKSLYNYVRHGNSVMDTTFKKDSSALDHMIVYIALFDDFYRKYNALD